MTAQELGGPNEVQVDENLLKDYSRAILECSPEAIVVMNGEGLVILASPSVGTVLGYDPDDLMGQEFSLFVAHEDLEAFQRAVRQSRQTQSSGLCSHRFRHGTGRGVSLETTICTIASDSGAGLVILHSRDVSLRAKIEEQLRLFSSAVEQVDEAMVLTDKDGVIQYVNRAFEVITGYSRDEAVGRTPRILKSGRHDAAHYEKLWATVLSGASYHGVVINKRKDGTTYHEDKTITPVKNEAGEVTHFISTGTDVTRQKLAEEKLIEGTERFALSVRGANDGMWDWDFRVGHVYLSLRWKTMLGYDAGEVGDHPEDWFRLVHPDDIAELKTQIKAHVAGCFPPPRARTPDAPAGRELRLGPHARPGGARRGGQGLPYRGVHDRHHLQEEGRGTTPARRPPRRPHGAAQQDPLHGPPHPGVSQGQAQGGEALRPHVHRLGPVQAHQRQPRPPRGRPAPQGGRLPSSGPA